MSPSLVADGDGEPCRLPWWPFYPGDFLRQTQHLTTEQVGAFILLLCACWQVPSGIQDDDAVLARITRLSKGTWCRVRPVLTPLFRINHGAWQCAWLEQQRTDALAKRHTFKSRAAKAANTRWGKPVGADTEVPPVNASSIRQAMLEQCPSQSQSQSQSPSSEEETVRKQSMMPADWRPTPCDVEELHRRRPDLHGAAHDDRMKEFGDWCRDKHITSGNWGATWLTFMLKSPTRYPRQTGGTMPGSPEEPWEQRFRNYTPGGFWSPMWGPRPESGECHAPKEQLAKWHASLGAQTRP